jgi:hypothetical protein
MAGKPTFAKAAFRRRLKEGYVGQVGRQAKRAHWPILAQKAKTPHLTVKGFFITRNPCKHWSKRVSGVDLSSMFLDRQLKKPGFFSLLRHAVDFLFLSGLIRISDNTDASLFDTTGQKWHFALRTLEEHLHEDARMAHCFSTFLE